MTLLKDLYVAPVEILMDLVDLNKNGLKKSISNIVEILMDLVDLNRYM